jgi:hypothetical protein
VTLNATVPTHWIHALVHAGCRLNSACDGVSVAPPAPARQASFT